MFSHSTTTTSLLSLLSLNAGVYALPTPGKFTARQSGESHQVTLVNNCGSGQAVFHYEGNPAQGSTTVSGELRGGIAWMSGMAGTNCGDNGVNCGVVEFTLINQKKDGEQNAADYSLLDGPDPEKGTSLGEHKYQYSMDFAFTGACTKAPGPCTGDSAELCPGGYLDSATTGGASTQCVADNVGITITFCSAGGPVPAGGAPAGGESASSNIVPSNSATVPENPVVPSASVSVSAPPPPPPPGATTTGASPSEPLPVGTDPARIPDNGAGVVPEGDPTVAPTVPAVTSSSTVPTSPPVGVATSRTGKGGWGHWTRAIE